MTEFTPLSATLGGALIGLAAVVLMATNGRIAGVSGIFSGVLPPGVANDWPWRAAFVIGLPLGALTVAALSAAPPPITFTVGLPAFAVAGALVGIGTRVGHGCTSGHGVCGLARLSPRSFAATATFMAAAAATVYIVRHLAGD
ncbi:MAG: YeeE/YedE family protein [Rhodospirillales bacterium]|nr:YeeE/YedE family protein [Rhodospirillales bacterium]